MGDQIKSPTNVGSIPLTLSTLKNKHSQNSILTEYDNVTITATLIRHSIDIPNQ